MVGSRVGLYGIAVSLFGIMAGGISPAAAITSSGSSLASEALGVSDSYIPTSVDPDDAVTERQLARVAGQVSRQFGTHSDHPIVVLHPSTPVSRLRVIATLVKLAVTGDPPAAASGSEEMPPDAALIPAWGSRYVAAAVEQGWWPSDRPLHPRSVASWNFTQRVLDRMLGGMTSENRANTSEAASAASDADPAPSPAVVTASAPAVEQPVSAPAPAVVPAVAPAPAPEPSVTYTGLILDARGLDVQRAMSPRIVDEDGRVLYPDPGHVPDMTFLQDHGMAAYVKDARDTPRSGGHPLTLWVVRLAGPGHDDLVISRKSARRLMEAEEQDGFLSHWAVSVLLNNR
jgi:hypothetical protein